MPIGLLIKKLMYKDFIKYIFDFVIALIGLIMFSPFFIVISIVLSIVNRGDVFFFQKRPGKNAHLFDLIKFKTMNDNRDKNGRLLPDAQRLTKFGKFIRSTSIDEVPQLFNVFTGDMSLVGPRPLLVKYLPLYSKKQARRHDVRPGMTGWAQVNGRNAISWPERFDLDLYYVNNISFVLDVRILFLTIKKIFIKEGINSGPNITMHTFSGNIKK
jgi:undecaprenyl phosphate N,N'-diacetylbacillosamine 1-phosphate transferase